MPTFSYNVVDPQLSGAAYLGNTSPWQPGAEFWADAAIHGINNETGNAVPVIATTIGPLFGRMLLKPHPQREGLPLFNGGTFSEEIRSLFRSHRLETAEQIRVALQALLTQREADGWAVRVEADRWPVYNKFNNPVDLALPRFDWVRRTRRPDDVHRMTAEDMNLETGGLS